MFIEGRYSESFQHPLQKHVVIPANSFIEHYQQNKNNVEQEINKQESTDNFLPYIEGKRVKDHQELANMINDYFINVSTLAPADYK
jgi:hypothetical protein